MKYTYYMSFTGASLWRIEKGEVHKGELSRNKPNDWIPTGTYYQNLPATFNACDRLTKREARRLFPLATIE